jgi:hypothetical protein
VELVSGDPQTRTKMAGPFGRLKRLPTFTVSRGEVQFSLRTVDPMFRFSLTRLVEATPTPPDSSSPGAEARFAASWDTRFRQEWIRLRAAVHETLRFKVSEKLTIIINPLQPNGNYLYQLLYQSVTLHFVFLCFV